MNWRAGFINRRYATGPYYGRDPWAEAHGYRHRVATRPVGSGRSRVVFRGCEEFFQPVFHAVNLEWTQRGEERSVLKLDTPASNPSHASVQLLPAIPPAMG